MSHCINLLLIEVCLSLFLSWIFIFSPTEWFRSGTKIYFSSFWCILWKEYLYSLTHMSVSRLLHFLWRYILMSSIQRINQMFILCANFSKSISVKLGQDYNERNSIIWSNEACNIIKQITRSFLLSSYSCILPFW